MSGFRISGFSAIYWCRGRDRHVRAHNLRRRHFSCRDSDRGYSGANRVCAVPRNRFRDNSCSFNGIRDFALFAIIGKLLFDSLLVRVVRVFFVLSLLIVLHD